jgi:regulatory protein
MDEVWLAPRFACGYCRRMAFRNSRKPRRKLGAEELYPAALGALARRAYSVHEMRKWLEERAEREEDAAAVMAKLKQLRYIDDARYAADFARIHAGSRAQGRFRIARELRARGIPDRHIEPALDAACSTEDEAAKVRSKIARKVQQLKGELDERKRASLYRSLLRAGFPGDLIGEELSRVRAKAKAAAASAGAGSNADDESPTDFDPETEAPDSNAE